MQKNNETTVCPDANGTMPGCAPLAVPYVPFQQTSPCLLYTSRCV